MSEASAHVAAHLDSLRAAARRGPVVDLACGRGRNALAIAAAGIPVLGLDRDAAHLCEARDTAHARGLPVVVLRADLEQGAHPPFADASCGALVVCRYLHRPLAPSLEALLRPGGLLLYETFTIHQRDQGYGPRNPAFLLEAGELAEMFPGLELQASWEGLDDSGERPAALARIVARKPLA